MIKLLEIEQTEENKYSLLVCLDGEEHKFLVYTEDHLVNEDKEAIWTIWSDDEKFPEIWGRDLNFRRDVASFIQSSRKKKASELQPA